MDLLLVSKSITADASPLLDSRIEETAAGLSISFSKHIRSTGDNATTITRYIAAMKNEVNLSDNYRKDIIEVLSRFSNVMKTNLSRI